MGLRFLIAFNISTGRPIASKVVKADTFETRSKGLLGREKMESEEGMWIVPCPMIHTLFMQFPIDVVFLDKKRRVRRVIENLKPWRVSPWVFSADSVLELPGGRLDGAVSVGDELEFRES